ncbi:MAG: hypothetical protein GY803_08590 [Chloroflexi bacterium]|nr:hypothetical protein [Chloroflexota bacterium]
MKSYQWQRNGRIIFPIIIGILGVRILLAEMPQTQAASTPEFLVRYDSRKNYLPPDDPTVSIKNGNVPSLTLFAYQPLEEGYLFTVRLDNAAPSTQYVITSVHHTDADYPQESIMATTDSSGVASAKIWSRCTASDVLTGAVFAQLSQTGEFQTESNRLECPAIQTVGDFGSYLTTDPANDDWIYRPSPPGPDNVQIWIRDGSGRSGLTGTIRILSAGGYQLAESPLNDEGSGLYSYPWPIGTLPRADSYRAQLTLNDGVGGLSGLDGFIKLSGRAMWVWGEAIEGGNPQIWAILTNEDYDGAGIGDRDEWIAFSNAPYNTFDPYATTSYLSIYPFINFIGTEVTDTLQAFLSITHNTSDIRVEALAGTYEWVETDAGLQNGKDLCDAILDFNRDGTTSDGRFDGIHYDVEHDNWSINNHWGRFIELLTHCQTQVNLYNQTHEPIVFGVDIPPHFVTGPDSSGQVESNWDVMNIVDMITLMDYRDFADVRWDGRIDGLIPRAEDFIADGNALGTPVVIGVELTENTYDHVTFFEECSSRMESELNSLSQYFATDWAYKGIAIHDYAAWKGKSCIFLPLVANGQ